MRSARVVYGLTLGLCAFLIASGSVSAKETDTTVRWRHTYGEALLEARLRNVPVLVTRHKDT